MQMATKAEVNGLYAAGLIKGIAPVLVGPGVLRRADRHRHLPDPLFRGYLIGAGIMVIGGLVDVFLGVQAAGKSPEQVTKPLTSVANKAAVPTPAAAPTAPARLAPA
jgi:hypothetical protein